MPGLGLPPADLYRGWREVAKSPFALLHGREFIGLLRLPLAANALVMGVLGLFAWLVVVPALGSLFATEWWLLDGLRAARASSGPGLWMVTLWMMLGPSLLDTSVGVLHEPLRLAAERTMLGPVVSGPAPPVLRARERARILGLAIAATPLCLVVVLLPWIGLPFVCLAGAAMAAIVWFEPPMAARGLDLRARLRWLLHNRWRALGTGAGIQLAAAVPFVNLLALSAVATVAATSAYLQFEKRPAG